MITFYMADIQTLGVESFHLMGGRETDPTVSLVCLTHVQQPIIEAIKELGGCGTIFQNTKIWLQIPYYVLTLRGVSMSVKLTGVFVEYLPPTLRVSFLSRAQFAAIIAIEVVSWFNIGWLGKFQRLHIL